MGKPSRRNDQARPLRGGRYLAVAALALALGGVLAGSMVQQGFSDRAAAVGGASTTAIALAIAFVASLFYRGWFPELDRFADSERREALHSATPYALLLAYVVVFVSLTWFTIPILKWLQNRGGAKALILGLAATWTTPVLLAVWIVRKPIRRGLRRQLVAKGLPICVQCGYDTRGLPEPVCPECGHTLPC